MDRPLTPKERASSSRRTRAEAGEPLPQHFDRALRDELLALYEAGTIEIDVPDLVEATTARLIATGRHSRRGCAAMLQRLMNRAEVEAGHGL
jgi:hypothetical protein